MVLLRHVSLSKPKFIGFMLVKGSLGDNRTIRGHNGGHIDDFGSAGAHF